MSHGVLCFQCLANVEAFIDFSEDENIEEDAVERGQTFSERSDTLDRGLTFSHKLDRG